MKSIIRTGIVTLTVFVFFGFPGASKADELVLQSDPNAGFMDWDWEIPVETTGITEVIRTYDDPPSPGTAIIGSIDPGTAIIGSVPEYTTYNIYDGYPYDYGICGYGCGYGYGAFGFGLGVGLGTGFFPTSTFFPTTTFVPTPVTTFVPTQPIDQSTTVIDQSTFFVDQSTFFVDQSVVDQSTYVVDNSVNIVNSGNTTVTNITNNPDPSVIVVTQPSPVTYTYAAPVTYATPQYTVQAYLPSYTYPSYTYPSYAYYPPPSCSITASNNYNYYNTYRIGQAVLSWNSNNASSAYISPSVGAVSTVGSTTVYPTGNQTYTLTVNGSGGTATCQTTAYPYNYAYTAPVISSVSNYTMPAAPYVALTQIPYTGFDFGPFGNALYWLGLILFAVAGAYLFVYYLPRLVFGRESNESNLAFAGVSRTASPVKNETRAEVAEASPAVSAPASRASFSGTRDAMTVEKSSNGGAPRIVIVRA